MSENPPIEELDSRYGNNDELDYDKVEEVATNLNLLRKATNEKDFTKVDTIIESMVSKSHVVGLKKLHTACGYGIAEMVEKYLKEEKCDPNSECSFNGLASIAPIHFCAGIGPESITDDRDKCVDLLVSHGANVNHLTSRNDTALHWATKLADFKVCDKLVKLGANVNQLNLDNCTCAHGAAFYKNIRVLEMLIENKCDVSVTDISGKNILHLLCKDSLDEDYTPNASNFSINEGTNTQNESEQNIPKQDQNQNLIKLVNKLIVEMKMDPNLIDLADFTSLMYACEQENLDLIQTLIDNGANVNFMNKDGVTCMILAIVNSCSKVVKLLLKCGFDLHKNLSNNFSYITDAAYLNDTEILNTLLDAGCDVNETKEDENGVILNPLWASCERGNLAVVEILLSKGARTIIREDLQMTALHCACMAQYESIGIVKLLVENKCPINMKSTSAGETPLFLASNSGYSEIVEYLLGLGINPNESSSQTRSCFQQAVFRAHKDIILMLINNGYILTDDDKIDLDLYIMDLYQDDDTEMLNVLLEKQLITKEKILDSICKVNEWRTSYRNESIATESKEEMGENELTNSSIVATLEDLKLEFKAEYPTTIEELDIYLSKKPNEATNFSDENDELK